MMDRRAFIKGVFGLILSGLFIRKGFGGAEGMETNIEKIQKTREEWKELLTAEQFRVLREEGTEKPFSSPLLELKEEGNYVCAGCDLPLFTSDMKYDSKTGWPSFYTHNKGRVGTKRDFALIWPRTEYHCIRCGGHQGHVFDDGPPPTYERWCNNGVALKFIPDSETPTPSG